MEQQETQGPARSSRSSSMSAPRPRSDSLTSADSTDSRKRRASDDDGDAAPPSLAPLRSDSPANAAEVSKRLRIAFEPVVLAAASKSRLLDEAFGRRDVAATRLHGISASRPRRRRDSPPRKIPAGNASARAAAVEARRPASRDDDAARADEKSRRISRGPRRTIRGGLYEVAEADARVFSALRDSIDLAPRVELCLFCPLGAVSRGYCPSGFDAAATFAEVDPRPAVDAAKGVSRGALWTEDLPRQPLSWGYLPQGKTPPWVYPPSFLTYPVEAQRLGVHLYCWTPRFTATRGCAGA